MTTTTTAYKFAADGFFNGTCLVMNDPISEKWLLPDDCILVVPEISEGNFYQINSKKTAWKAVPMPANCAECEGLEVKHSDNTLHGNTLRILFSALVDKESDAYELHRDEDLTLTVVKKEIKERTLEDAKQEKQTALTTAGHAFDNQLVNNDMVIKSSLGFNANADLRSQNNINGLLAVKIEPVTYMDADNQPHNLSLADLAVLLNECSLNGQNLYAQKWTIAQKINACKTIKAVDAIEIKFEMMDFSK